MSRNHIAAAIQEVLKPLYFEAVPLQAIQQTLQAHQVTLLQEDGTPWEGFLTGAQGRCVIDLGEVLGPIDNPRPLPFSLALQWFKMPSGRFEVNGYLT